MGLFGFQYKVFRVVGKSYLPNGTVELTLKEDAPEIWDLADAVTIDATPNTGLPNPFALDAPGVPAISEELYETTGSSGVKYRANISWAENTSIRVTGYICEFKLSTDSIWTVLPITTDAKTSVDDLPVGVYNFRVKALNAYFNTESAYSGTGTKELVGLTDDPGNISNFNVIGLSGRALASWDLTVDLDVKIGGRVVVRHSPLTTGATWENGIILEEFNGDAVNGNLPLLTGTYFAKFKDSLANYSATAASFVATESLVSGYTTTHTLTEHTAFTGSKTNLTATGSVLKITTLASPASGEYLFSTHIDLGTVVQRKIDMNIKALSYDSGDLIDSWPDFDSRESMDGGVINDTDCTGYYRTTNDDPAGSPTWGSWTQFIVADVYCRGLQFKAILTTQNATHQIELSELSVRARSQP